MAPVFAVDRLRMGTDGPGVTTLVTFCGCPLKCRYCLNEQCHRHVPDIPGAGLCTPRGLLRWLRRDNIYFLMSGGGVCFGGGEPLLRHRFIRVFRRICPQPWRISVETSLAVPRENLEALLPVVDRWIVDIKDMNPLIYRRYTGADNGIVLENLRLLATAANTKVTVRVPHIPDFNSPADVQRSIDAVHVLGFDDIDEFTYLKPNIYHKHSTNEQRETKM